MKEWIKTDDLFCDNYKAVVLCEYSYEMTLIKQLIEIAEKAVDRKKPKETWDQNGICALFAKSIVDYSKMAYDNFVLGHFSATNMINRVIIENNVCLDVILRNEEKELWKYYLAYSYKKSIKRPGEELSPKQKRFLEDMYVRHQIDSVFLQKRKGENAKDKRAFIDRPYGWTYKINNQFSFEGLCKLVNKDEYNDFRMMSEYSHGTAIYLKLGESTSVDHIMNMISFTSTWVTAPTSFPFWMMGLPLTFDVNMGQQIFSTIHSRITTLEISISFEFFLFLCLH